MAKITKISIILLALFISSFVVYYNSNFYIEKYQWKQSGGASIGDFLTFDDSFYTIKGRKVYTYSNDVGYIIFCSGKHLIVYSKNENDFGCYHIN